MRLQDKHILLGYKGSLHLWTVAQNISFSFFHLGRQGDQVCVGRSLLGRAPTWPVLSPTSTGPILVWRSSEVYFSVIVYCWSSWVQILYLQIYLPTEIYLNPQIHNWQSFPSHSGTCTEQPKNWSHLMCTDSQVRSNRVTLPLPVSALIL